jgi:hypothetical protein
MTMKEVMLAIDKLCNISLSEMLSTFDPEENVLDPRASLYIAKADTASLRGTSYTTDYASFSLLDVPDTSSGCTQKKVQ